MQQPTVKIEVGEAVLYSQFLSSCSYRVRIDGFRITDVTVIQARNKPETHSPEFMSLNYMAQVPVLDIDDEQLPQSNKSLLFRLDEEKRSDWALHYINKGFRALEAVLAKTAGQYCVGDSLTIADVCLVPMVYQAKRLGVDMAPYPVVEKLNRSLEELPSFRLGHPRCQPDTPEDMREEEPSKRC
ncbi:hypothetical protein HPB47_026067 [Ixodes persulcatus]|uniref:Uncharacterized protein n=1 Tax=Ixodes persulcatus TaxID=34615 RepID=A0AC60PZP9_IXOPE|nr:hypothetical protein HPB47_026067 [Ixodes persulcatus]